MRSTFAVCLLLASVAARAQDAEIRKAREEVERQLREIAPLPPSRLTVVFQPLDEPSFRLEQLELLLDGRRLPIPDPSAHAREALLRLFEGELTSGTHTLSSRAVYVQTNSMVLDELGGFKWTLPAKTTFQVQSGLAITLRVVPAPVPTAAQTRDKLKLTHEAEALMVAALDDGQVPDPPSAPAPTFAPEASLDAGLATAAAPPESVDAGFSEALPAPAPAPEVSPRRKKVTLVGFRQNGTRSVVFVQLNEATRYQVFQVTPTRLVLELQNASLGKANDQRSLDTSFFRTPVASVRPKSAGQATQLEIRLKARTPYEVIARGNEVRLEFNAAPRP